MTTLRPLAADGVPGSASDREVVVACSSWGDGCRRGMFMPSDRLLQTVLSDDRFSRVLVANPFRSAPVLLARRLAGQGEPPLPDGPGGRRQVTPVRLRRHDPVSLPSIKDAYARYERALRKAARSLGMSRPAIVCGNPFMAAFSPLEWASSVVFYAWDDWASYPPHEAWWPAYEAAYETIRSSGRPVVAVSQVLLDRVGGTGPQVLIPNGLAPYEWERPGSPPGWFAELPGPRLLYIGTLDDRLDLDVVRRLAASYPDGTLVLVGTEKEDALNPVRGVPNVHIHPPVARDEVAAIVHGADVCIMPHRRTPLTEAMSPLKLYEYVAGGRPVVATDLPPARGVAAGMTLVDDSGDFVAAVRSALERGPMTEADRRCFVMNNSWSSRFEVLFELLWRTAPDGKP